MIYRTEYVYLLPDEQYLQSYPDPVLRGPGRRDLVAWGADGVMVHLLHESDKAAMRQWMEDARQNNDSQVRTTK